MWDRVIETIRSSKTFVLTSHVDPDGDALGSELALYYYLKSLGKKPMILNSTAPAKNFTFMAEDPAVRVYSDRKHRKFIEKADAAIIVDISEWGRLGLVGEQLKNSRATKICIDHHICPVKHFDLHVIDNRAASTGEIIYRLIKRMKKKLNPKIAENLYISALTDTGSFRYPNTSPLTHNMVAELLRYGVNPQQIFGRIYEQYSAERFRLLGHVLLQMKLGLGGKLAWAAITQKLAGSVGAEMDDTEGFAEMLRTLHSVKASIVFREAEKNKTRVSLRSKDNANVYRIAKKFGGGGHRQASGITVNLPIAKAVPLVLREARKSLKNL